MISLGTTPVSRRVSGLLQTSICTCVIYALRDGCAYIIWWLNLYRLLCIQIKDPLQCHVSHGRWIAKYVCLGKELPHEYRVSSSSVIKSLPWRFNTCKCGVVKISGRKCVILFPRRWSESRLIQFTPSIDAIDLIQLKSKSSFLTDFAIKSNPKGKYFNPLCGILTTSIFRR